MKAITVEPHKPENCRAGRHPRAGYARRLGARGSHRRRVCRTDVEIVEGEYGWAPRGQTRLVLGHESLAGGGPGHERRVSGGDLVVGIVRRPDPVPCPTAR